MRNIPALVTLLLLVQPGAHADSFDPRYLHSLAGTTHHEVRSSVLGRSLHAYIRVPDDGDSDKRAYPVVYVLDGGGLFPLIASYHNYLQFGEGLPQVIIVGISYGARDFAGGNFRSTDYTAPSPEYEYWGGAARFQRFLAEELFPLVETSYPARPDRRILFGQSIGGQFVLFTAQTKPSLFWGHIASNPALHRNLEFFLENRRLAPSDSRLFVASATGDEPQFREPALRWVDFWTSAKEKSWDLEVMDLPGHSHMSAPPASYRYGMRWLFESETTTD